MGNFHNLDEALRALAEMPPEAGVTPVKALTIGKGVVAGVLWSNATGGCHSHAGHEELLIVLKGDGDFRVGDEVRVVHPGDYIYVPRGALHGTVSEGGALALLSIITPPIDLASDIVFEKERPSYRIVI